MAHLVRSAVAAFGFTVAAPMLLASCGQRPRALPPPTAKIVASPASGDLSWSIGATSHVLRAGAVTIGPGGWLQLTMADGEVPAPCDSSLATLDRSAGMPRLRVEVPRGLDLAYPLNRTISPESLELLPLAAEEKIGSNRVQRYGLEIESVEWKPGGRVVGHVAWVSSAPKTFGEGRFDLPLCASQPEIDDLQKLPKPHAVDPSGPVKGHTAAASFQIVRGFAELRPWFGLPPHVIRIELFPDPLVSCSTRRSAAKGTALIVEIDSETGLGKRNGSRQPIRDAGCEANAVSWPCFGERRSIRGFVDLRQTDLRVGGTLRGLLAMEGDGGAAVSGAFDVEICSGE